MKGKMGLISLAVLISAVLLVGFGFARSGGQAAGEEVAAGGDERPTTASGGRDEAPGGDREATLVFKGDRGMEFSGTCVVDGEERAFRGEVPERLEFSPNDGRLECEINKEDPGSVELTLTVAENVRSVQKFGGPESTVRLSYENGGLSTSAISSGGNSSSSQQTTISGSSRSIVSSSVSR